MAESVCFPKSFFKKEFAISMDYGGSAIKLVYTTDEGENLRMNFAKFKKESLDEALDYLKDKCKGQLEAGCEMNVCGFGASAHKEIIEKALNISLTTIPEGDTGLVAFQFMAKHLPYDVMFHPASPTATEHGSILAKQFADIYKGISHGKMKPFAYMEDVEANDAAVRNFNMGDQVEYPVLLVGAGSALMTGLMHDDGTFLACSNINGPAGRTFLGLGSLLTGAKDFHELAELAERGNPSNVDQWLKSVGAKIDDPLYSNFIGTDLKVYAFGHASGRTKEDFKKEDLAAAVLSLVVTSVANEAYFWAAHHKVKQVYFIGGFSSGTSHIREEMAKEFAIRRFANSLNHICDCRFMKEGAQLGATGVLLSNLGMVEELS